MFGKLFLSLMVVFSVSALGAEVQTGKPAPDFTLKGADGKTYTLSKFKGKNVVLEWFNNDCPYVKKHYDSKNMQNIQKDLTGKGTVWLTIASNAEGKQGHLTVSTAQWVKQERGMSNTALLVDGDSAVGKLYGAKTTPHMFVVDKKGTLVYQGAIDNNPSSSADSIKGAKNYIVSAIKNLDEGKPVETSDTDAYGCSTKF